MGGQQDPILPKLFVTDREGPEKQIEAATGLTLMQTIRNIGLAVYLWDRLTSDPQFPTSDVF
jgi:hypothetical protein